MAVYSFNPLIDPRWNTFLREHPKASVFHSTGWLESLRLTYGYEPFAITTSPPTAELTDAVVLCRIRSWLTGRRLVSLPFSDHCEPLVQDSRQLGHLLSGLKALEQAEGWQYIELRPVSEISALAGVQQTHTFLLHRLDLRPGLSHIIHGFHKDCIQRKISRAEREALRYEDGKSEELLRDFYRLVLVTRRRQGLPPQPLAWFRNLIDCMGDGLKIRLAFKDGRVVAGILTLSFKDTLTYKYGCSDKKYANLGGMHLLLWRAIQEASAQGLAEVNMGRSDSDNHGLIEFKSRWGAIGSNLTYWRDRAGSCAFETATWSRRVLGWGGAHCPDFFLTTAGRLLYRHIG